MPLHLTVVVPLTVAAGYVLFGWTRLTRWLGTVAAATVLLTGLWSLHDPGTDTAFGGWLRADPAATGTLIVVGAVATLALAGWPSQLAAEIDDHIVGPVTARWYGGFAMVALCAAVVAAASRTAVAGAAVMVVALAGLVASRRKPAQLRAASYYGAGCGVGVGLVAAGSLAPEGVTGSVLTLLGWAALAGLAPLHWWLPPTVSVATAPVSVLIVGVQSPVAFAALTRVEGVPGGVLVGLALASVAVAVAGVARQRDLRRLVGYLGVAGFGLATLAVALGADTGWLPLCLGLNAAVTFLATGHVVSLTGSPRIATIRGLLWRSPRLGIVLGVGLVLSAVATPALGYSRMRASPGHVPALVDFGCVAGLAAVAVLSVTPGWRMLTGDPADRPDLTTGPARPLGSAGPVLVVAAAAAIIATIASGLPGRA